MWNRSKQVKITTHWAKLSLRRPQLDVKNPQNRRSFWKKGSVVGRLVFDKQTKKKNKDFLSAEPLESLGKKRQKRKKKKQNLGWKAEEGFLYGFMVTFLATLKFLSALIKDATENNSQSELAGHKCIWNRSSRRSTQSISKWGSQRHGTKTIGPSSEGGWRCGWWISGLKHYMPQTI